MKNVFLKKEFSRGGVSMFIVIITTVLIAIISASFVRLMIRDGGMASVQDLSQSAYDSAQAGVEDAKRFMTIFNQKCYSVSRNEADCQRMNQALATDSCNMLHAGGLGVGAASGETVIQTSDGGGEDLNQAYTCLKLQKDSSDFLGEVAENSSKLIPLRSTEPFDRIKISWHNNRDSETFTLDNLNDNPTKSAWGARPAMLKAQFFGADPSDADFEKLNSIFSDDGIGIDERLYRPVRVGSGTDILPSVKRTSGATSDATNISCEPNLNSRPYACEVTVSLAGGGTLQSRNAFLRLTPLYRSTNFKIELYNGANLVKFDAVQPVVDSTGRANDQFRRVESRIEPLGAEIPVPDFAVQTDGAGQPFCKDFWVTYKTSHFECE